VWLDRAGVPEKDKHYHLSTNWRGPYRIHKKLRDVNYILINKKDKPVGSNRGHSGVNHVSQLKMYREYVDHEDRTAPPPRPPCTTRRKRRVRQQQPTRR